MTADKQDYFAKAAKRMAASTVLYGVDSVVHVENKDDIWFWQQVFAKYRDKRYKFMPATKDENGNATSGCAECLKYNGFLSQRFFICIDSDLRYLSGENISANQGILQTYTYSWENHCAFTDKLQRQFDECLQGERTFNFISFLQRYSQITYKPLLLMLYQERNGLDGFRQDVFRQCISLQYKKGDETDDGAPFLQRMEEKLQTATEDIIDTCGFDFEKESARYSTFGLNETNAYLYVRGHCLYNSLMSIGRKLCEGTTVDFEYNIMKSALAFEEYNEINKIKADIGILNTLRITYR